MIVKIPVLVSVQTADDVEAGAYLDASLAYMCEVADDQHRIISYAMASPVDETDAALTKLEDTTLLDVAKEALFLMSHEPPGLVSRITRDREVRERLVRIVQFLEKRLG